MSEGIVRQLDDLGRITIPKEYRKAHAWDAGTAFEETIERGRIILTPVDNHTRCALCHEPIEHPEDAIGLHGRMVCKTCARTVGLFHRAMWGNEESVTSETEEG